MNSYKKRRRPLVKKTVSLTLFIGDIVAMCLAIMVALISAPLVKDIFVHDIEIFSRERIHDLFFLWICPFVLFFLYSRGHYTQRVPWWTQVQHLFYICFVALIIDGFVRFAMMMTFSRLLIGLSWMYTFLFTLAVRQFVYQIYNRNALWTIPTIVIGDTDTIIDTLCAFRADGYTGYDIQAVYIQGEKQKKLTHNILHPFYKNIHIKKNIKNFDTLIEKYTDHVFIIALESFRGEERDKIINVLSETQTLYSVIPPVSRLSLFDMEPHYFFGYDLMLLHTKTTIVSPWVQFIKRSMDIVISSACLILFAPLMGIIALCLKYEGQDKIFYDGMRIGQNGHEFKCWKFQTMQPHSEHLVRELFKKNPEAYAYWRKHRKIKSDPRVKTRTGRFLRKTSLDELPQLWNVLIGDMSLVGPRPILPEEKKPYRESINLYYKVRPGISGLWQVSGRNDTSFNRRVYWDSWYVRNWTLWGDIVILIKTVRVVLCGLGAY